MSYLHRKFGKNDEEYKSHVRPYDIRKIHKIHQPPQAVLWLQIEGMDYRVQMNQTDAKAIHP